MNKSNILTILALSFLLVASLNLVSASGHTTFDISEKWIYQEDIVGEDRGFTLKHSFDVPRNTCGFYDWSYKPKLCGNYLNIFPSTRADSYGGYGYNRNRFDPDRLPLEAFKTFQADSQAQTQLEFEKERNRHRSFGFGYSRSYVRGYGGYGYGSGSYGGYSYPRSYNSYRY